MDNQIVWAPGVTLESVEKQVILAAFRFYRGNKTVTANALGIAVRTLDNKLDQYEKEGKHAKEREEQLQRDRDEFLKRQRGPIAATPVNFAEDAIRWNREAVGLPPLESEPSVGAATRNGVEPVSKPSPQQPVPVPKREEVQKVLPSHASQSGVIKPRR